ncbi:hypothetical protein [Bradyrhizobium sp. RD5-C2]|uniref:hypothetical protein n=1 Tax=Bradyrhizobium sp. RD5-C2 TaxID=244562 RepID=UPI001CC64BB6|nr:hypothetical protein [Bradyrhizobium sp. RD5-C2]
MKAERDCRYLDKETIATTAAVIVFPPAAFLVGGDKQTASEIAQMKANGCNRTSLDRQEVQHPFSE